MTLSLAEFLSFEATRGNIAKTLDTRKVPSKSFMTPANESEEYHALKNQWTQTKNILARNRSW
jgi:hypothetical protein